MASAWQAVSLTLCRMEGSGAIGTKERAARASGKLARSWSRSALGAALVAIGVAAMTTGAIGLLSQGGAGDGAPRLRKNVDVVPVETVPIAPPYHVTYDPGYSSGWHVHAGQHDVTVLSGALTVYGDDCRPEVYSVGQRYVGGRERHLASNEAAEPLKMVVRWLGGGQGRLPDRTTRVEAPGQCLSGPEEAKGVVMPTTELRSSSPLRAS